jgi:hypothetical protein
MLPDGAEKQLEDWTIFFLNQTPFNTISPVLALETPELNGNGKGDDGGKPELLYVLNLVRTKHDKTVRRCVFTSTIATFPGTRFSLCSQRCSRQGYGDLYTPPIHPNI